MHLESFLQIILWLHRRDDGCLQSPAICDLAQHTARFQTHSCADVCAWREGGISSSMLYRNACYCAMSVPWYTRGCVSLSRALSLWLLVHAVYGGLGKAENASVALPSLPLPSSHTSSCAPTTSSGMCTSSENLP